MHWRVSTQKKNLYKKRESFVEHWSNILNMTSVCSKFRYNPLHKAKHQFFRQDSKTQFQNSPQDCTGIQRAALEPTQLNNSGKNLYRNTWLCALIIC